MSRQFVYSVHDLQTGGREYDAEIEGAWVSKMFEDTELMPCPGQKGALHVRLSTSGRDVVVRGWVRAPVQVKCARCLTPTTVEIKSELALLLMPGRPEPPSSRPRGRKGAEGADEPKAPAIPKNAHRSNSPLLGKGKWVRGAEREREEYEFTQEEADVDLYDGDEVVLDPFLRELILLEMPIFHLCSEQCPGIRPTPDSTQGFEPGADPVDPRLLPLRALRAKKA